MKNTCLNCKNDKFVKLFNAKKFPLFFGAIPKEGLNKVNYYPLTISKCKNCNLVQQVNLLDQDIINSIYTADYYNCSSTVVSGLLKKEKVFFVDFLNAGKLKSGEVLEVACYDGYVLDLLKNKGWDVYGCDPNLMVKFAQKKFGSNILPEMFDKKSFGSKKFDIIFFRNLLEHLYDTSKFLKEVKAKLKKNGSIYIEVPNIYNILNGSVFGSFFHQHISYFSIETLKFLLNQNGFDIERYYAGDFLIVEAKVKKNMIDKKANNSQKVNFYISEYNKTYSKYVKKFYSFFNNPKINKICLFGASAQSTSMINLLNSKQKDKIKIIIDNDSNKIGKYMIGTNIKIKSPNEISSKDFDYALVMSFMYYEEMKENLKIVGIKEDKIQSFYD